MNMITQTTGRWERLWTGPVWVKIVVCVAVGLAFGLIMGALIDKASGEEPTSLVVTANQGLASARGGAALSRSEASIGAGWNRCSIETGRQL